MVADADIFEKMMTKQEAQLKLIARSITALAVRNTFLEELHSGISPVSQTNDFSDVTVVTPTQSIPWNELSLISDTEMKRLMQQVVNKLYTSLLALSDEDKSEQLQTLLNLGGRYSAMWDEVELDSALTTLLDAES